MTKYFKVQTDETDRLTFNGKSYTVAFWKDDLVKLRRVDDRKLVETFNSETIRSIWDRNDFRYEPFHFSEHKAECSDIPRPTVGTLNQRDKHILLYRLAYVQHWLGLLGQPNSEYKRTYASAKLGAMEIQPLVDGLGVFKKDANHQILAERTTERKGRVGQPMVVDGQVQYEKLNPPSGETLMNWLWTYQRSGADPMSLKPEYGLSGFFGSHLDPEVEMITTRTMTDYYLKDKRATVAKYLEKVRRQVKDKNKQRKERGLNPLGLPGKNSIERAIAGVGAYHIDLHRHGQKYADEAHPWNGDGLTINVPGQRVEIDAYEVDLQTLMVWSGFWEGLTEKERKRVRKKRMWLTVAIDRATRCILAMKLSTSPSVPNAIAVLDMIESDKSEYTAEAGIKSTWHHRCGVMTAVMDGGYVSREMREAMADARGTVEYPRAGDPKMRAVVERIFRTVATDLMARLNGKTFSNILERGDYDSEGEASLTVDDLAWLLVTWVVDVYHNSPHRGLGGRTPNQAWDKAVNDIHGVHPWRDAHGRRTAFGVRVERTLTGDGFTVLGNHYRDDDVDGLKSVYFNATEANRERKFEVAVDLKNLGAISVIIDEVAIMVPCRSPRMEGVKATDWIEACAQTRAEIQGGNEAPLRIAWDALDRIEKRNESSGHRAGIFRQALSSEKLETAERDHFLGFRFLDEPETTPSEVIGHSIGDFAEDFFIEEPGVPTPAPIDVSPSAETVSDDDDDWTLDD